MVSKGTRTAVVHRYHDRRRRPEFWIFRRDPTIRIPWPEAVLRSDRDVPYLAPDLQILFKSKDPRPKDDLDATEVIPELTSVERSRLHRFLPEDHPWQAPVR